MDFLDRRQDYEKILFFLFTLFFSLNVLGLVTTTDNFVAANGTDLNVHDPRWSVFSTDSGASSATIQSNQLKLSAVHGSAIAGTLRRNFIPFSLDVNEVHEYNLGFSNVNHIGSGEAYYNVWVNWDSDANALARVFQDDFAGTSGVSSFTVNQTTNNLYARDGNNLKITISRFVDYSNVQVFYDSNKVSDFNTVVPLTQTVLGVGSQITNASNGNSANLFFNDFNLTATSQNFSTVYVLTPVKENSPGELIKPYNLSSNDPDLSNQLGLSNNYILNSNLNLNELVLTVDINNQYFPRQYSFPDSNEYFMTLQPYLIDVADGIEVVFTILDSLSLIPIPNISMVFSSKISGNSKVVQASKSDTTGDVGFNFIPNKDYNFSVYNSDLNFLFAGNYFPLISHATSGFNVLILQTPFTQDLNAVPGLDVHYTPDNVASVADGNVSLNQVVTFDSNLFSISFINIQVDHNGVNLFDQNYSSGVAHGGSFDQNIVVSGLDNSLPLTHTITITFSNGVVVVVPKNFFFSGSSTLASRLQAVRDSEFSLGGTMVLSALILGIVFGFVHVKNPSPDNTHSFVFVSFVCLLLSLFGWIDGVSWVLASVAGGSIYFMKLGGG